MAQEEAEAKAYEEAVLQRKEKDKDTQAALEPFTPYYADIDAGNVDPASTDLSTVPDPDQPWVRNEIIQARQTRAKKESLKHWEKQHRRKAKERRRQSEKARREANKTSPRFGVMKKRYVFSTLLTLLLIVVVMMMMMMTILIGEG